MNRLTDEMKKLLWLTLLLAASAHAQMLWDGETNRDVRNSPANTTVVDGAMRGTWLDSSTNPVIAFPDTKPAAFLRFDARGENLTRAIEIQIRDWGTQAWLTCKLDSLPGNEWRRYSMPLSAFTPRDPARPLNFADHIVFATDRRPRPRDGVLYVDNVYFDADVLASIPPEPEPNADRRVFRITDGLTAIASTTPLDIPHLAYSPISLGKVGTVTFAQGHAYYTDQHIGPRGGMSYGLKVSRSFKPDSIKRVYFGAELNGYPVTLSAGQRTGAVWPGGFPLSLSAQTEGLNPWTGEVVYSADFSALTTPGTYRIVVDGVGATHEFTIDDTAFDVIAGMAARGLALQTTGLDIPGDQFTRVKSMLAGIVAGDLIPPMLKRPYNAGYVVYDAAAYALEHNTGPVLTGDAARILTDAADHDCNILKHSRHVIGLLEAYIDEPEKYTNGQWGLPNDTAYPDIVQLALYELQVWSNLQDAFGSGGVPSVIQSNTQRKDTPPGLTFVCSQPDRLGSYIAGACFQRMGIATGDPAWFLRAKRAYDFGIINPYKPQAIRCISARGRGEEYAWALTQAAADALNETAEVWRGYLKMLLENEIEIGAFPSYRSRAAFKDTELYVFYELAKRGIEPHRTDFKFRVDRYIEWQNASSNQYRQSLKPDAIQFGFGSMQGTLPAVELLLAYELFDDVRYRLAAEENLANARGVNKFGRSWVSYDGEFFPRYQDSTPYVPGTMIYGVTSPNYGVQWPINRLGMRANPPRDASYVMHPSDATGSNEMTSHESQSPLVEATARLATPANAADACNAVTPMDAVAEASASFYLP